MVTEKNYKMRWTGYLMAALLVLNIFTPYEFSYANAGDLHPKVKLTRVELNQNEQLIQEGNNIDSSKEFKFDASLDLKFNTQDPSDSASDSVSRGDVLEFLIAEGITLRAAQEHYEPVHVQKEVDGELQNITIGQAIKFEFVSEGDSVKGKISFKDEIFDYESFRGAIVQINFGAWAKSNEVVTQKQDFTLLSKSYFLMPENSGVPDPSVPHGYQVEKTGKFIDHNTIRWTIELTAPQGKTLADHVLLDELYFDTYRGYYIDGTFTVDSAAVSHPASAVDTDGNPSFGTSADALHYLHGGLSYKFPSDYAKERATVTLDVSIDRDDIKTKIAKGELASISNVAKLTHDTISTAIPILGEVNLKNRPDLPPTPDLSDSLGISKKAISYDKYTDTIEWEITVKKRASENADLRVYEVLSYANGPMNLLNIKNFPSGLDHSQYADKQTIAQRYLPGSFSSPDGLKIQAHNLLEKDEGLNIGQILEISGFSGTEEKSFKLKTQVVSPYFQLRNVGLLLIDDPYFRVENTAILYDGNKVQDFATARQPYAAKTHHKEILERSFEKGSESLASANFPEEAVNSTAGKDQIKPETGYNYQEKAVIYRLSINPDGMNFAGREFFDNDSDAAGKHFKTYGDTFVEDILPDGWHFTNIKEDQKFLIFRAQPESESSMRAIALGNSITESEADLTSDFSKEGKALFTFKNLDQPYVILLRAEPKEDTLKAYHKENKMHTLTNRLDFKSQNWNKTVGTAQADVAIVTHVLEKFWDKEVPTDDGVIRWRIEYKTDGVKYPGAKITDVLPNEIELLTDENGNLLFGNKGIQIKRLPIKADKNYVNTRDDIDATEDLKDSVSYDKDTRTVTFAIPNETEPYSYALIYHTQIVAAPKKGQNRIENTARLEGASGPDNVHSTAEYTFSHSEDSYVNMMMKLGAYLPIRKISSENEEVLKDAKFELSSGGKVRSLATAVTGRTTFWGLKAGDYVLKEVQAPAGYTKTDKTYYVRVTDDKKVYISENKSDVDSKKLTALITGYYDPFEIVNQKGSTPPSGGGSTPPSGGGSTPPSGGGSTPPSGGDSTPPSGGGSTPPSGGDSTPPSGGGSTPPSGGGSTPPSGGGSTPPSGGGSTPPSGGDSTPPSGGGSTPPSGGGSTPPSGGGSTPPSGGGSTPPSGGGSTPPSGGSTPPSGGDSTPPSGGGSTPPSGGGSTPPSGVRPDPFSPETLISGDVPLGGLKNSGKNSGSVKGDSLSSDESIDEYGVPTSIKGSKKDTKIAGAPKTGYADQAMITLKRSMSYGTILLLLIALIDEYKRTSNHRR